LDQLREAGVDRLEKVLQGRGLGGGDRELGEVRVRCRSALRDVQQLGVHLVDLGGGVHALLAKVLNPAGQRLRTKRDSTDDRDALPQGRGPFHRRGGGTVRLDCRRRGCGRESLDPGDGLPDGREERGGQGLRELQYRQGEQSADDGG